MNILSTSKIHGRQCLDICPLCNLESETVDHFLLKCVKYNDIRNGFIDSISSFHPQNFFQNLSKNDKMRYILNVNCPPEAIGICCNFLFNIYTTRVKDASTYS